MLNAHRAKPSEL